MNNKRCSEGPEEDRLAFFAKMQACANRRSELWNKVAAGETRRKEWTEDTQWKEKWQI